MTKRFKYAFAKKQQSEGGITSTILAGISFFLFFVATILSSVFGGKGGLYLGAIGFAAMIISIYGFGMGLKSFSKPDCSYTYSKVGALANGIFMIAWLGLFLIGV